MPTAWDLRAELLPLDEDLRQYGALCGAGFEVPAIATQGGIRLDARGDCLNAGVAPRLISFPAPNCSGGVAVQRKGMAVNTVEERSVMCDGKLLEKFR